MPDIDTLTLRVARRTTCYHLRLAWARIDKYENEMCVCFTVVFNGGTICQMKMPKNHSTRYPLNRDHVSK